MPWHTDGRVCGTSASGRGTNKCCRHNNKHSRTPPSNKINSLKNNDNRRAVVTPVHASRGCMVRVKKQWMALRPITSTIRQATAMPTAVHSTGGHIRCHGNCANHRRHRHNAAHAPRPTTHKWRNARQHEQMARLGNEASPPLRCFGSAHPALCTHSSYVSVIPTGGTSWTVHGYG